MPFVTDDHRKNPNPLIAGDRCYVHYRRMMTMWKTNPRWTTFDEMARFLYPDDEKRALFLALLVFFVFHAVPYEELKMEENGDIE